MEYHERLPFVCTSWDFFLWLYPSDKFLTVIGRYDGVPAVSDYHTLTEILREEWGYKYWVTSDAGATDRLCTAFKLCRSSPIDKEAVTLQVLPAGNDVEMGGGS
jgi:beta-glucosidase